MDLSPESRYEAASEGFGLSGGLSGMPPDALLCLHPSTLEGTPSPHRQRDLNSEPEPESEEPDGGFRKVRELTPRSVPKTNPHK